MGAWAVLLLLLLFAGARAVTSAAAFAVQSNQGRSLDDVLQFLWSSGQAGGAEDLLEPELIGDCNFPLAAESPADDVPQRLANQAVCLLHIWERDRAAQLFARLLSAQAGPPLAWWGLAVALGPEHPRARSEALLRAQELSEARGSQGDRRRERLYIAAEQAMVAGDLPLHDRHYLELIGTHPEDLEALHFWAHSLLRRERILGAPDELAPLLTRLVRHRERHPGVQLLLLLADMRLGAEASVWLRSKVPGAVADLSRPEFRLRGETPEIAHVAAAALLKDGRHEEAVSVLRSLLREGSDNNEDPCALPTEITAAPVVAGGRGDLSWGRLRSRTLLVTALGQGLQLKEMRRCGMAFQALFLKRPTGSLVQLLDWTASSGAAPAEFWLRTMPALASGYLRLGRFSDAADSLQQLQLRLESGHGQTQQGPQAHVMWSYYESLGTYARSLELLSERLDSIPSVGATNRSSVCDCDSVSGLHSGSSVVASKATGEDEDLEPTHDSELAEQLRRMEESTNRTLALLVSGSTVPGVRAAAQALEGHLSEVRALAYFMLHRGPGLRRLSAVAWLEERRLRRQPFAEPPVRPALLSLARAQMCVCDWLGARQSFRQLALPGSPYQPSIWSLFGQAQSLIAVTAAEGQSAAKDKGGSGTAHHPELAAARGALDELLQFWSSGDAAAEVLQLARKQRSLLAAASPDAPHAEAVSAAVSAAVIPSTAATGMSPVCSSASSNPLDAVNVSIGAALLGLLVSLVLGAALMWAGYTLLLRQRKRRSEQARIKLSYVLSPTTYMRAQEQLSRWANRDLVDGAEVDLL